MSLILLLLVLTQGGLLMDIIYGYCRCSRAKQQISRQVKNILGEFPNAILYKEYYTGTTTDRPVWNKLKKLVKPGSTIVFDSVSRMSRDSVGGFEEYKELYLKGVNLVFLNEPHINTDVFRKSCQNMVSVNIDSGNKAVDDYFQGNIDLINKLLLDLAEQQIKIAFDQSEKEVKDIEERVKQGLREARSRGVKLGLTKGTKLVTKKSVEMKTIIRKRHADFGGDIYKDEDLIKIVGCSRNTYFKYKRELKEELNK